MNFCRVIAISSFLCALFALATVGQAQNPQVVANAKKYLDSTHNAKQILMLTHLGATLQSYSYAGKASVQDPQGNQVFGHFALLFDYNWLWNGQGYTRLAFLYDEQGIIYQINIVKTNGTVNSPFELSSRSIQLVGGLFVGAMRGNANEEELRNLEAAVRNADTKSLLIGSIKIGQAAGIRL